MDSCVLVLLLLALMLVLLHRADARSQNTVDEGRHPPGPSPGPNQSPSSSRRATVRVGTGHEWEELGPDPSESYGVTVSEREPRRTDRCSDGTQICISINRHSREEEPGS